MRRLLRWTFHALAAASLLLCVATAALWVRSYWVCDRFYAKRLEGAAYAETFGRYPHNECRVASNRGQLVGSFSWVAKLPADEREQLLSRVRELLEARGVERGSYDVLHQVWVARLL